MTKEEQNINEEELSSNEEPIQESEPTAETETETTMETEEPAVENFEEKYNVLNDTYLRLRADFDNYRKRMMQERVELIKTASEKTLVDILPIVDDFERGLQVEENEGMKLIYDKFISFLAQNGVKPIETKDQVFNTDFHEAVTLIPAPTEDMKGKVIDCIQKGYMLGEKVIRYSKVVVGE